MEYLLKVVSAHDRVQELALSAADEAAARALAREQGCEVLKKVAGPPRDFLDMSGSLRRFAAGGQDA